MLTKLGTESEKEKTLREEHSLMCDMSVSQRNEYLFGLGRVLETSVCRTCLEKIAERDRFIKGCYLYPGQFALVLQLLQECISPAFLCAGCWERVRPLAVCFQEYKYKYPHNLSVQKY